MTTSVAINGLNLYTQYGFSVDGLPTWRAGFPPVTTKVALPGRLGSIASGPWSTPPRPLQITGTMYQTTASALVTAEDQLRYVLTSGLLTVDVNDGGGFVRQVDGYSERIDVQSATPSMVPLWTRWNITILCPEACWRDIAGTVVGCAATSTRYSIPLGNESSDPILRITGSATNPSVTIRDSAGNVINTLAFTVSLTANDWLDVNCQTGVITKYASGVTSNGASLLTSGTFPFTLDPTYGDFINSNWLTVETSAGTAELLYTRRWV